MSLTWGAQRNGPDANGPRMLVEIIRDAWAGRRDRTTLYAAATTDPSVTAARGSVAVGVSSVREDGDRR